MSAIKLTATGGGGGTVSLKAPTATQSNGALELTLPTQDGSADTFLKTNGSGALSFAAAGGGKVVQQVYQVYSTATQISSTSLTDTGYTVNITPVSASNIIHIRVNYFCLFYRNWSNVGGKTAFIRTPSGGSPVTIYDKHSKSSGVIAHSNASAGGSQTDNLQGGIRVVEETFDTSYDTTTTLTYKVQAAASASDRDARVTVNENSAEGVLVVTEYEV